MADRQRQTFKAQFRGMNTREPPDAEPAGKWPLGVNIRSDGDTKLRTRPGYVQTFNNDGSGPITDLGSYASLNTDSRPRILTHDSDGKVFMDDPAGPGGSRYLGTVGAGGTGASIIPFRPSASPQSWAYIGNGSGYDKFSAPDANGNTLHQKTGIAEPQPMPQALQDGLFFHDFTGVASNWVKSGTASPPVDTIRLQDTVGVVFPEPVQPPAPNPSRPFNQRYYVSVTGLNQFDGHGTPTGDTLGKPISYQIGERLDFGPLGTTTDLTVVEDVFPAIGTGDAIEVEAIYYLEGQMTEDRHRCVIVPSQVGLLNNSIATAAGQPASGLQPPRAATVQGLRRGSMIQLNAGEILLVENVITGPNGQLAIETATTGTHQVGELITGVLSLAIANINPIPGQVFFSHQINFQANSGPGGHGNPGLAVVTYNPVPIVPAPPVWPGNPFNMDLGGMGVPQENDLLHISISAVPDPGSIVQDLIQLRVSIDIDDGTFERNTMWFPVSTSLLGAAANTGTPGQQVSPQPTSQFTTSQILATNKSMYDAIYEALRQHGYDAASVLNPRNAISINPATGEVQIFGPNGRLITLNVPLAAGVGIYTELIVSLSSLQRTGLNHALTLANATAVQIAVITSGTYTIGFGGLWVGGGGQPDTGSTGSPYYYRAIGRSSLTGAISNPSPAMRYGVTPRCQPVLVQLPKLPQKPLPDGTSTDDDQVDTWDIYRYGGTITSWRLIGSAHASDQWYRDNIFDAAAFGGSEMEMDNYEPWPTVDIPWHPSGLTIDVVGTLVNIFGAPSAFPASIHRWLAGTLVTLNLNTAYTLWNRPVPITGGWQLQLLQAAGAMVNPDLFVAEPIVANQPLPYLWGPDANGYMFGCGDIFRPGTFQTAKANDPDATPNNAYDLTPPSEPILGGQIMDGLSVVASSKRWWQLQPSQDPARQWNPVEMPTGRGLAAPFAHTTDGKAIYFWCKDGIWAMVPNAAGQPLTNDIANLFPQGESGITHGYDIEYAGYTIYAPEYKYAASFRLSVMNYMLRAHYRDCSGTPRTLICDLSPDEQGQLLPRWSVDDYTDPMVVSYQPAQPPSTLLATSTPERYQELYYGDTHGGVWQETDLHNDGIWPFTSWASTAEWDGGDSRVRKDWMDSMVDVRSPSGGTLSPVSNGVILGEAQEIEESDQRQQFLVKVGEEGEEEPPHRKMDVTALGILFKWRDDFTILNPHPDSCPKFEIVTTLYEFSLEFVPQPVQIKSWESIWTNCGLDGYWFIYRMRIAYQTDGDDPVHLKIDAYDRNEPEEIELPGTGGRYVKTEFVPTFNKFLLAKFHLTSDEPFALIQEDTEIVACQWGRTGMCTKCNGFGGSANP